MGSPNLRQESEAELSVVSGASLVSRQSQQSVCARRGAALHETQRMAAAGLHSQAEVGQAHPSPFRIRESNLHQQLTSHATSHPLLSPGLGVVESTQPLDVRRIAGPIGEMILIME